MADTSRLVAKRLPLLNRQKTYGPRTGTQNGPIAQQAGDVFWKCGVEVAKVIYTQIDARYPFAKRGSDLRIGAAHAQRMDEAKKILNEHRNEVIEAVLPLFDVRMRKEGETLTEADVHANDYIVKNQFDTMVRTFKAWSDEFVEPENVKALENVIDKVAVIQRERLEGLLLNFAFGFRVIPAPKAR
jgi:hypothetical protein